MVELLCRNRILLCGTWFAWKKKKGDLGVKNLALMDIALLTKWNWRFANEREVFWKQVINHKYGEENGGLCSCAVSKRYGVGLWKTIRKEWMCGRLAYQVSNG